LLLLKHIVVSLSFSFTLLFGLLMLQLSFVMFFSFLATVFFFPLVLTLFFSDTLFLHLTIQFLLDTNALFLCSLLFQDYFIFFLMLFLDHLSDLNAAIRISDHRLNLTRIFI
jgi:hypothetical protein